MPPPTTRSRRQRLSREEKAAETRQALIDATVESLSELGYERSTTIEISDRAGLSRGAHQHHFQTRAALISAAVEELARRATEDMRSAVARLPTDERRPGAALDMVFAQFTAPLFQVVVDLSVYARTDAELRAVLDPIEALVGRVTLPMLREAFGSGPNDRRVDDLLALIMATTRGLAIMPLLEPKRRVSERWKTCRAHLVTLLEHRAA